MRKLASVQKIKDIQPIENADNIEVAIVNGWEVVIAKNVGHKIGDLVVYCEIDSFLPIEPEFEFLRKSSYKKMGQKEGFRLRTIKLRGQISQGLIIPLNDAYKIARRRNQKKEFHGWIEGQDVSEELGIIKYEKPIPAQLSGKVKRYFPSFMKKTDEERIQNLFDDYPSFKDRRFQITEKLDGTSFTCYLRDGEFGVCSRNMELKETEDNVYWQIARKYDIENILKKIDGNFAIQGEIVGSGIQKNVYDFNDHRLFVFNVFSIDDYTYLNKSTALSMVKIMGLDYVPVIAYEADLASDPKDLLYLAEGESYLNSDTEREGLVFTTIDDDDNRISFKAISNKFLLNE